jgi:hypothetical protein
MTSLLSDIIGFHLITVELGYHTRSEMTKCRRIIFKWMLGTKNGGERFRTVSNGVVWYGDVNTR